MIDERQSSIIRPKAVPPMFTTIPNSNHQSSNPMNQNVAASNRAQHQALVELSGTLRKHDPGATHLHDCLSQVKLFAYNSQEFRWENAPNIEGNLCAYERKSFVNNNVHPSFSFAVIQADKSFIQPIGIDMVHQVDKLRIFYEVARNGRREVFCIHFPTENECQRLNVFLTRCNQALKKHAEQTPQPTLPPSSVPVPVPVPVPVVQTAIPPAEIQPWMQGHMNGQASTPISSLQQTTPNNVQRQQSAVPFRNQTPNSNLSGTLQLGSGRMMMNATPTRLNTSNILPNQTPVQSYSIQTPIDLNNSNMGSIPFPAPVETVKPLDTSIFVNSPIALNNGNGEDPTSSLKRLLNIRSQTGIENLSLDDNPALVKSPSQTTNMDLMPPSAFEPINTTPSSPLVAIGAERIKPRAPNTISREHFRNVLLHLIQTDDRFLDIIYQACLNYPNSTQ